MKNVIRMVRVWLSTFQDLYDVKDDYGRGRLSMLVTALVMGVVAQFHGGVFYTRYLLLNGIDQTGVGVMTFLPYIGCLFGIFSPYIMEHFPRRKWILFFAELITSFTSIMGITILPFLVEDAEKKLVWFVVITVSANLITNLFQSGITAWDAVFLPENVRPDYLTTSAMMNNMVTWISALAVSFVADKFSGTEREMSLLVVIRCVAWALTLIKAVMILIKKEFPYAQTERVRLINVVRLPIRNKLFLGTMAIAFVCNFVYFLPNATINVWLLEDVGISYTLINGINATYFLFCIVFSNMWARFIKCRGWFVTLAVGLSIEAITYLAYAFVSSDTVWLYVVVRLAQHFTGVPIAVVMAAFVYINLPQEDKTYYVSFSSLTTNLAILLSMMTATGLTKLMEGTSLNILGISFVSTQVLLLACGVGKILVSVLSMAVSEKLSPRRLP